MNVSLRNPSRTGLVLLMANAIPLFGVLFFKWNALDVLKLYWAENVVYGMVNLLRFAVNQHPDTFEVQKLFMAGFFALHYGLFTLVHGHFVFSFGGGGFGLSGSEITDLWGSYALVVASFFASHLYSFYQHDVRGEARREWSLGKVMSHPYQRIVILHVTIIFGGMAVLAFGSPTALVAVLVVVKTLADLFLHLKSHRTRARKPSFL